MSLIHILKNSIALPRKNAVFRLNRVGMGATLLYVFLLIFLLFLPDGIEMMFNDDLLNSAYQTMFILQMIIFYPLAVIFSGLVGISLLAGGGMLITMMAERKLTYHLLWKMSAYALTIPLILYALIQPIGISHWAINLLLLVLFYFTIYKMITIYPKRRNRKGR